MYRVEHHIRIGSELYSPGDIIDGVENPEFLLKQGAITRVKAPFLDEDIEDATDPDAPDEDAEALIDDLKYAGKLAADMESDEEAADEAENEAARNIDMSDGVVTSEQNKPKARKAAGTEG